MVELETEELLDWSEGASLTSDETVRSARTSVGSQLLVVRAEGFLVRGTRGDKIPEVLFTLCGVLLLERSAVVGRGGTSELRALGFKELFVEVPGVEDLVGETSPETEPDALADTVVRTEVTELGRLDTGLGTVGGAIIAAPVRAVALVVRRRSGFEGKASVAGL
jgi:hypothetical protein